MDLSNIKDYIKVYDNLLGTKKNNQFYETCVENFFEWQDGEVVRKKPEKDLKYRSTKVHSLTNVHTSSMTEIHWANIFNIVIRQSMDNFAKETNTECKSDNLNDVQILKYDVGGFYKKHVDSGPGILRTLRFLYFVNDNFEGGELIFKLPNNENIEMKATKDRMLVWPSNFLYPHEVQPVRNGIKYSVVAWSV